MTWGFSAQRRADQFDALVASGGTATDGATLGPDAREAELLELVGALRSVPTVTARPEFVADLRDQLMAEAATALAPADTSRLRLPERRPARERRLAAIVGGIAIAGVTTGVAVASQNALPGEALYPIKRVIESAHAGISVGEGSRGSTILASASDRLDEVDALVQRDDFGDDLRISDTLDSFTDQATEGSDLLLADYADHGNSSSITELHEFTSSSLTQLAALEPLVPASSRDELIRAARTLQTIDAEATQRCPDCGTPIESIPPVLADATARSFLVVPQATQPSSTAQTGKHHGSQGGPDLPDVQTDDVGPGSVTDPSSGATSSTDPLTSLVQGLTDPLTGGGDASSGSGKHHPSKSPSVPSVGDVVDGAVGGVGEILGDIVGGLTSSGP